jgi:ATP-dependent Clp protease ATP-binding subunit ClpX
MSDPNFPGPEELQRRLQAFLQSAFQQQGRPAAAEPAGATDEPAGADKNIFDFNLTPRDIKAHLDRFVIKQDEAKKVLSIAVCDHYNQAECYHHRPDRRW